MGSCIQDIKTVRQMDSVSPIYPKVTTQLCRNGDSCAFFPLCLFRHPNSKLNDQHKARLRNVKGINGDRSVLSFERKIVRNLAKQGHHLDITKSPEKELYSKEEDMEFRKVNLVVCNRGEGCEFKPRCKFSHPEGGNDLSLHAWKNQGEKKSWAKKKIGGKECKHGINRKPLCLFLHPEGGNDHE